MAHAPSNAAAGGGQRAAAPFGDRCPTLILHSRDDAWAPSERSREMARLIPGSRLMELPGANHIILPQDPAFGTYLREIVEFLSGAGKGRTVGAAR